MVKGIMVSSIYQLFFEKEEMGSGETTIHHPFFNDLKEGIGETRKVEFKFNTPKVARAVKEIRDLMRYR